MFMHVCACVCVCVCVCWSCTVRTHNMRDMRTGDMIYVGLYFKCAIIPSQLLETVSFSKRYYMHLPFKCTCTRSHIFPWHMFTKTFFP